MRLKRSIGVLILVFMLVLASNTNAASKMNRKMSFTTNYDWVLSMKIENVLLLNVGDKVLVYYNFPRDMQYDNGETIPDREVEVTIENKNTGAIKITNGPKGVGVFFEIEALKTGEDTVTVTAAEDDEYFACSKTIKVKVVNTKATLTCGDKTANGRTNSQGSTLNWDAEIDVKHGDTLIANISPAPIKAGGLYYRLDSKAGNTQGFTRADDKRITVGDSWTNGKHMIVLKAFYNEDAYTHWNGEDDEYIAWAFYINVIPSSDATPTKVATATPTKAATATPTKAATATPTKVATATPTKAATATPTKAVTATPAPTSQPSTTATATPTPVLTAAPTQKLIVEPWMEENETVTGGLKVSIRSESTNNDKVGDNIFELNEVVTYYIDYINTGDDITSGVEITLQLPLDYEVVDIAGGTASKSEITWTFPNGIKKDESGTIVAKVKYTSLRKSTDDANTIYPMAIILQDDKIKDVSTVINYIIAGYKEELKEKHSPYMYGDANSDTFRPDYLITRAEGALVLARVFGLEEEYKKVTADQITTKYTDLGETYFEAQQAITITSKYGLTQGYLEDDGTYTYRPNTKMTKAEFITILARMIQEDARVNRIEGLEIKKENELIKVYKDETRAYYLEGKKVYSHWALPEVSYMARLNMLTFLTAKNPSFNLGESVTRAEVAQLVNAYLLRGPYAVTSRTRTGFSDVDTEHPLVSEIIEATRSVHTAEFNEKGEEI